MPVSKPSASDQNSAFDKLASSVRRWIRKQGWPALRPIQSRAIPTILGGGDVIVAAATASGKTEAAFLPLVSRTLAARGAGGFRIIYLAPIKALINDQYQRLESLCREVELPLFKWHGDVAASTKKKAREKPGGILLITPESLEATLMRRGGEIAHLFGSLDAFIVDELHAFIGTERGVQLLSLMSRIETAIGRRVDRIGLSATLGDMKIACDALRCKDAVSVQVVEDKPGQGAVDVRIRTFEEERPDDASRSDKLEARLAVHQEISLELFGDFQDSHNLIFANSRERVEVFSDCLRELCEKAGVRTKFLPHHGKLSKELREHAEAEIKGRRQPITIVATSTLEMGVDIGSVENVAQISASSSVAALRQRVGRSGRREGQVPSLRQYVIETAVPAGAPPRDHLRLELVLALATTELLRRGWCEPPLKLGFHFSTLVHQSMALIAQNAGCPAIRLYQQLCLEGPFQNVSAQMYEALLRSMASEKLQLIEQAADGTLLLGRKGERRAEHFSFYAVFPTREEFRIVSEEQTLGTIEPDTVELAAGYLLLFAGRRWTIQSLDLDAKIIRVVPAKAGRHPTPRSHTAIDEEVGREMLRIYLHEDMPDTLDGTGRTLLAEGRAAFRAADMQDKRIQGTGTSWDLYPWTGTRQLTAIARALAREGIGASADWPLVRIRDASEGRLKAALEQVASSPAPTGYDLLCSEDGSAAKPAEKFDYAVPADLRELAHVTEQTDPSSIPRLAAFLLGREQR